MKFIHTADLHIDQPFSGIDTEDMIVQGQVKEANQHVLKKIIDSCIEESVDFLLVVGDTFHQAYSSIYTQKMLMAQFERLNKEQIPVVLSFGNHDYYTENRYWFDWPENVVLYTNEQVETNVLSLKNGESVSISGFSYEHQWIQESMVAQFPEKNRETTYHIGFYHGEVGQAGNYAPFTVSNLPVSYDYWGLGHIHKSGLIAENPLVVYPGSPQGHTKKETQTNGVVLVEINQSGRQHKWLDVSMIEWLEIEVDVRKEIERSVLLAKIETELLKASYPKDLTFISLTLKLNVSELSSELIETKEDVMGYLQQAILKESGKKVWLVDLTLMQESTDKLLMGFDASLIDDLGKKYENPSEFHCIAKDILQQPVVANYLNWTEMDRQECVRESSQLVKDRMIFKNEASR